MDAKNGEKRSLNGADDQGPESPPSLVEAISKLASAMDQQNSLLMELLNQNAVLIGNLVETEEVSDPAVDMAGNPIRVT